MLSKHFPGSQGRLPQTYEETTLLHITDYLAKEVSERTNAGQDQTILLRLLMDFRNHLKRVPEKVKPVVVPPTPAEPVEQMEATPEGFIGNVEEFQAAASFAPPPIPQ